MIYIIAGASIFSFFIVDTPVLAAQELSMAEHEEEQENQRAA
jgi:hypothetical protein